MWLVRRKPELQVWGLGRSNQECQKERSAKYIGRVQVAKDAGELAKGRRSVLEGGEKLEE